jgi:hypothetical protein
LRLGIADVEAKVMLTARANVGALQNSRLAVRTCSRCAKRAWTNYAHQDPAAGAHNPLLQLLVIPAELDVPAHARAGGDGDRSRLDVADDHSAFEDVDPLGRFDVALQLSADHDDRSQHLARQVRARLDVEVAVDAHIALEAAGDAHVARSLDLALDAEVRRDDGFAALTAGDGPARRGSQGRIARSSLGRHRALCDGSRRRGRRIRASGHGGQGFFATRRGWRGRGFLVPKCHNKLSRK